MNTPSLLLKPESRIKLPNVDEALNIGYAMHSADDPALKNRMAQQNARKQSLLSQSACRQNALRPRSVNGCGVKLQIAVRCRPRADLDPGQAGLADGGVKRRTVGGGNPIADGDCPPQSVARI